MNTSLKKNLSHALKPKAKTNNHHSSGYRIAKGAYHLKRIVRREIINALLILAGVMSAGFGLESFLIPNKFIDGGVTGISLLVAQLSGIYFPLLLVILNIPFILLGFTLVGQNFSIKTLFGVLALAAVVSFLHFPVVTSDKTLISVFGGFFVGAGIGLAVRGGGVLDGTEVLALFISRKSGLTIGDIILLMNILVFGAAAYFLGIETALYSLITYLSASKTMDFLIEGIEEYTGATIISAHSDAIRHMVIEKMGRGVTIYQGRRGFGKRGESLKDVDVVYTVITRLEISKLNAEIEKIDPNAFVVMSSIKDTKGGMIKKRPLKK